MTKKLTRCVEAHEIREIREHQRHLDEVVQEMGGVLVAGRDLVLWCDHWNLIFEAASPGCYLDGSRELVARLPLASTGALTITSSTVVDFAFSTTYKRIEGIIARTLQ